MNGFKLTAHGSVIRLSDNAIIPPDPDNTDYAEFLVWKAAGGVPDPVDPPSKDEINVPILAQISELEAKQARPLREIRLAELKGLPVPEAAVDRLQEIDAQVSALRCSLAT